MKSIITAVLYLLFAFTTFFGQPAEAKANPFPSPRHLSPSGDTLRNGQHDFDFNIGNWKTHIRRRQNPFADDGKWLELNGTVTVRKVWNGRAQLEEIEADGPTGHFEGLTLFLYNPTSHQWSQNFASSADADISNPTIGEFKNGRGELFSRETFNGRTVSVKGVWSNITPDSHRYEEFLSDDGGKTWESAFIGELTRDNSAAAKTTERPGKKTGSIPIHRSTVSPHANNSPLPGMAAAPALLPDARPAVAGRPVLPSPAADHAL